MCVAARGWLMHTHIHSTCIHVLYIWRCVPFIKFIPTASSYECTARYNDLPVAHRASRIPHPTNALPDATTLPGSRRPSSHEVYCQALRSCQARLGSPGCPRVPRVPIPGALTI